MVKVLQVQAKLLLGRMVDGLNPWVRRLLVGLFLFNISYQAAAQGESRFLSRTRQLTYEGRRSGEGYFSPDGRKLVFQSEREPNNPFYQIYLLDLETGDTRRLSPGFGKTTCAFFRPGSDEVLFASSHLDIAAADKQQAELEFRASGRSRRYAWDYDETFEIHTINRDGTGLRRLTTAPGYDAEAAYSPDGRHIVFCSLRHAYPTDTLVPEDRALLEKDPAYFGEIYIMDADGSNPRRLTHSPGYDGGPFFSPDGARIVWRRFDATGAVADIYTMNLEGQDVRRLTDFNSMSWAPYYHPSGKYIIFASNPEGFSNFELYMVDVGGAREPVRVTFTEGFDGLPVFSPDGARLAWTSNRTSSGESQIHLAEWNHLAAETAMAEAPLRRVQRTETVAASDGSGEGTIVRRRGTAGLAGIDAAQLRETVEYLASDALEGRLAGTPGVFKASEYLAERLQSMGVQPLGEDGTYFQTFQFNAGVRIIDEENSLTTQPADTGTDEGLQRPWTLGTDFRPLSMTASGSFEGDVVFAGYGLTVPEGVGPSYDSYAGLNVSNKVVLVLRYVPEGVDSARRQEMNRHAGLRYKAMIARNRGARALLVVTGPNSPNAGELAAFTYDTSQSGSGILAASISGDVAAHLLSGSGTDLATLQSALDTENPHVPGGMELPGVRVGVATGVRHVPKTDRNVLGWIPPAAGSLGDDVRPEDVEVVLIGAHHDHLGRGETGGFAIKDEEGKIHNGADDNASGCAAVLEIAAALMEERRNNPRDFRRGVMIGFWSGEELGLIGSTHFVEKPVLPLTNIVAYVNFDMVGRLRENRLILNGTGSSSAWRRLLERRNVAAGFNLQLLDDPYAPTDVTAFYPKGIPVLAFFTGSHEEYHRPADKSDTLDYEGLARVTVFGGRLVRDLVVSEERLEYAVVDRTQGGGGSRDALRAYLGTIPDYATDVVGVKVAGTRGGSPADRGGMRGGDVLIEFGGQKISNIYDYTYALDAVKIGFPVRVVVLREGNEVVLEITPEARK